MTVAEEHVPSPADAPRPTADELLSEIVSRGGRVFRMPEIAVFVLTTDEELARWLLQLGGKTFLPNHLNPADLGPRRAYKRTREGPWEWDIYIHSVKTNGERTIHEAAKDYLTGEQWRAE